MKTLIVMSLLLASPACAKDYSYWAIKLDVWASSTKEFDKTPGNYTWPQTFENRKDCETVRRLLKLGDLANWSAIEPGPAHIWKFESHCEFVPVK